MVLVSRGIPSPLFLFAIAVEALRSLFSKTKVCGFIDSFEFGRGEEINHLHFADGTILFSSLRWEEAVLLETILSCFELSSASKINLSKSMLVGVGCQNELVQTMSSKLHCKEGKLPFYVFGIAHWAAVEIKSSIVPCCGELQAEAIHEEEIFSCWLGELL